MSMRIKKEISLTDSVYRALRRDLIFGRIPPSAQLKTSELATKYDVSLTAVREALSRLTSEGLVEAEPQRGFRAAAISAEHLQDITAVRVDIETACLRQSIAHWDLLADLRLDEAMEALLSTAETDEHDHHIMTEPWSQAHAAFHDALVANCPSAVLLQIRRQLFDQSERYRTLSLSLPLNKGKRDIERDHRPMVEAVHARDLPIATNLLVDHIRETTRILLSAKAGGKALIPRDAAI
jgi:DNA-binding GntR family transcriptional regulator